MEPINPATEVDKAFPSAVTVHKGPQPSPETNGDGTFASGVPEERQSDRQATANEEEKNGPCGHWKSSRPCGVFPVISLASPEQPRETGSPQQWPKPKNFLQAKSRSFQAFRRAKGKLSQ